MNKVVCNLCGTSYPENATQCPICGQVRSAEVAPENSGSSTYTYVKGGRFSKTNVKKRNRASAAANPEPPSVNKTTKSSHKKSGLIVVMIVLLLAIVLVLGYIAVQIFLPDGFNNIFAIKPASTQQETTVLPETENTTQEPSTESITESITEPASFEESLSCQSISLAATQIEFDAIGVTAKLIAKLEPADTTDQLYFSSSDPAVASVTADGTITAIAEGSAVITVSCGNARAECNIICAIPEETFESDDSAAYFALNRKEITFDEEGQTWLVYDGDIAVEEIVWISDDDSIATVINGRIIAIGNGDTTIYGIYNDQTVSCIIHCNFDATGEFNGITEAGGDIPQDYKLFNPIGYADDVTIYIGDQFPLQFVDANENEVSGVQWSVTDATICSFIDGIVEATNFGTTEITATYNGVTYTCTVRVIEQ